MEIRLATESDRQAWDHYVLKHPDGVAYHQFAWGLAVADAYNFRALYLLAESEGLICGVLPIIALQRFIFRRTFVSLPYCDLGGCLADNVEIAEALHAQARLLAAKWKAEGVELRQKGNSVQIADNKKVRMVLELQDSSESLLRSMKSKLRSQIKKPLRDGLTARVSGVDLIEEFYDVFTENMRDLGSPVHSRRWFDSILEHYGANVRLGVVYTPEGRPAAAGLILLHGEMVSIPWASSLRRYNQMNANMLLYWEMLAYAADHGYRYFDFGRSTPGEGTYRFKAQWGAQPVALRWITLGREESGDTASRESRLRKLAEKVWANMPLLICNKLGPKIRKRISL